jgi:hypothetical protein
MLLEGERAMAVDTENNGSNEIATANWAPKGRRHGEPAGWSEPPQKTGQADNNEAVPFPAAPPVSWPRVFPGI